MHVEVKGQIHVSLLHNFYLFAFFYWDGIFSLGWNFLSRLCQLSSEPMGTPISASPSLGLDTDSRDPAQVLMTAQS